LRTHLRYTRSINNATLIQYRTYNSGQEDLASLLDACGGDWPRFLVSLKQLETTTFPKAQEPDVRQARGSAHRGSLLVERTRTRQRESRDGPTRTTERSLRMLHRIPGDLPELSVECLPVHLRMTVRVHAVANLVHGPRLLPPTSRPRFASQSPGSPRSDRETRAVPLFHRSTTPRCPPSFSNPPPLLDVRQRTGRT